MRQPKIRCQITQKAAHAIVEQADYYIVLQDESLAQRWDTAVHEAIRSLLKMPERGTPCNFKHPRLRNLRRVSIPKFPKHLMFYEYLREERLVCIVHVIHGARDVEGLLADPS
jgi:plasmid stabilization system protein ParE